MYQACIKHWEYKVDKLDLVKLVPVPADLRKLSDLVKIMLLKKLNMMN